MAPAAPWNGSFKHAHLSSRPTGSCDRHTRSTRPVRIWDIADISAMANKSMPVSEVQERLIDLDALLFCRSHAAMAMFSLAAGFPCPTNAVLLGKLSVEAS